MPLHPAWAKNVVRQVFAAAISPEPTKEPRMDAARYLKGRCAYCGVKLTTRWHLDHLVPFDLGGSYGLNLIRSCKAALRATNGIG